MDTKEIITRTYPEKIAEEKRDLIRREFIKLSGNIKSGDIKTISEVDLRILFGLYDRIYFDSYFKNNFINKLTFTLSKRMSRNAGKTVVTKSLKRGASQPEEYEIVMAVKFFFNYEELNRDKKVNGIKTTDSLHAFQLVFEHEICHLIEFYLFKTSDCKTERFKKLAYNFFKHTDVYHQLPTEREIAIKEYSIRPGDGVEFEYEGKRYKGIVNRINKRATVMVANSKGDYMDKAGTRYSKWYVPLSQLKST